MKLLIFEYAAAMGLKDPSLTVEGRYMLQGIINDVNSPDTSYLQSVQVSGIKKNSCTAVPFDGELLSWLEENISNYYACLPIAPEENQILYNITLLLEQKKIKVIGSSSKAVLACSDKYSTYNLLKDQFPMVKTYKIFFNNLQDYKEKLSPGDKMLVKPADGISCSGVHIVHSYTDFIQAASRIKRITSLPYFILQEYQEGQSASVSILTTGTDALPVSLNEQDIKLDNGNLIYNGGKVPYEHPLADEAKKLSKKVVESVPGLMGYVGVDLLLDDSSDEIYVLEINPRITTSYVALRKLVNFNLGRAIINVVDGILPESVDIQDSLSFRKEDDIIFK